MKTIMIMFDTLNRRFLPPYDSPEFEIHAPNFKRLAEKTVIFDNSYVGSLPCMPARRELHTGRINFLHRSWGPIEPFDDSMPEILGRKGIYTHLVTDHYHYWEDGGCTYHNRYNSYELIRGHEGDLWKGEVKNPEIPEHVSTMRENSKSWRQDWVNRKYMQKEEDLPQSRTFKKGIEFMRTNSEQDNWFLQIETFDPHEPYYTVQKYRELYKDDYKGPHFDWPNYDIVKETPEQVEHCRKNYAASLSMCDANLGKILDLMDELDLWKDTMLIVNTDHGFMLGEKGWWAKMIEPLYNEIAHTPLFIWDPRTKKKNERRDALVQTIDLAPTILQFFGVDVPKDMQGINLKDTIAENKKIRNGALFGVFGAHVNVTDGRYVYMRAPISASNAPLFEHTHMPTHMNRLFSVQEMKNIELEQPFSFTKGCKTMKIPSLNTFQQAYIYGSFLFDLENDSLQENPIINPEIEKKMITLMRDLMKWNDAPETQFVRLGIPKEGEITDEHLILNENRDGSIDKFGENEIIWRKKGKSMYYGLLNAMWEPMKSLFSSGFEKEIDEIKKNDAQKFKEIDDSIVLEIYKKVMPVQIHPLMNYFSQIILKKGK